MMKRALAIKNRLGMIMFSVLFMIFTSVTANAGAERMVFSKLTATDKKTGLMWTRDANIAKEGMTWKNAFKFIEELNKQKYAGYSDWRLPTYGELQTLADYARSNSAPLNPKYFGIEIYGFKNVQVGGYWSSSASANDPAQAWVVTMLLGSVEIEKTITTGYVWPVRAGR